MFKVNQIVKGIKAGTFVILALRSVGGEAGAQVKSINPADHTQVGHGEMWLPITSIKTF